MRKIRNLILITLLTAGGFGGYRLYETLVLEKAILKQVIERLGADSRVAEVLVTGVQFDEKKQKTITTIKFLEYDTHNHPMEPRYFTFFGNIIQFQSLVIRFDDAYVKRGDLWKGKSAYLFWKIFMLDGANTQEYTLTSAHEIPRGYKLDNVDDPFEAALWQEFWQYALQPDKAQQAGIKNAQIEAPGTMFIPGYMYTIRIEHDGGLRIDAKPLPAIMRGEKIPK